MKKSTTFPKISLVTTCYNHKDYIAETIESILSQGYPNLEYIVIDDGSTDGSWDVIKEYKDKLTHCERIEGYRPTPTIALNNAMKKTTGEIMGWLNSDDVLLPNSLFVLADFLHSNQDVQWVTGSSTTININSQFISSKMRFKHKYDYLMGDWNVIQQESTFWSRDLWNSVGGSLNEDKKNWAFDTELWTRFFTQTEHVHITAPLGAFRKGKQSKSVSDKESFLEPNYFHLNKFKKTSSKKDIIDAKIFRIFKNILGPFLAVIPHKIFSMIPYINKFVYILYQYNFKELSWEKVKINPFRKVQ